MADTLSTAVMTEGGKVGAVVHSEANGQRSRSEDTIVADQNLKIGDIVQGAASARTKLAGTSPTAVFIGPETEGITLAEADLTFAANPTANDTVTIGGRAYKFVAAPSSDDDIDIGSDAAESLNNLIAAINGGVGSGTAYDPGTPVENPDVTAKPRAGDVLRLTAKTPGAAGNAVTLASAGATEPTFSSTTLLGGKGLDPATGVFLVRDCEVKGAALNYFGQVVATIDAALLALGIVVRT